MKPFLLIAFLLAANIYYAQNSYKSIEGIITDNSTSNPIVSSMIFVHCGTNGHYYFRGDSLGRFHLNNLPDGLCSIQINCARASLFYKDTILIDSKSPSVYTIREELIVTYDETILPPISNFIKRSKLIEYPELTYQEIQQSVNKFNLTDLISGMSPGVIKSSENELSFRGARINDYTQFIDGVKCSELHQLPVSSMKSLTVMTGFIPAKYGDTNGAVILLETMSYMDLWNERQALIE